ncbi:hypothetical protein ACOACO_17625 [Nocardioides sp. CPCC 205120]|uniref:hypothetical protein n=1 Tax=Nocardioides sp. CPCC 205120 TaxID=3406462 RepID=UPI003B511A8A
MSGTFRAIWPIVDESRTYAALCREAAREVPEIAARSRARLTGPGRFSVAPSESVPGSGRLTDSVLVYEAPAEPSLRPLLGPQRLEVAS